MVAVFCGRIPPLHGQAENLARRVARHDLLYARRGLRVEPRPHVVALVGVDADLLLKDVGIRSRLRLDDPALGLRLRELRLGLRLRSLEVRRGDGEPRLGGDDLLLAMLLGSLSPLLIGAMSDRMGLAGFEWGFALMGGAYVIGACAMAGAFFFTFERDRVGE